MKIASLLKVIRIELVVEKLPWPWPSWATATTIWPIILYEPDAWADKCVREHERYHWKDQLRWGVLPWLVAYGILALFFGGGRKHPLEHRAYQIEDECRNG